MTEAGAPPDKMKRALASPFVIDTPEGQERLEKLINHHRREFLISDLPKQAALVRLIRENLVQKHSAVFEDSRGVPLDDDAIGLGIAKAFYLPNTQTANEKAAFPGNAASAKSRGKANADASTMMEEEDCQAYQFLASMRNNPVGRLSSSPTEAAQFPKIGIKAAAKQLIATKRKSTAKAKKPKKPVVENGAVQKTRQIPANFPTREEVHTLASTLLSKTHVSSEIPKGVTVRPSGRWQSQVYYKGHSRYLGVFSDSREAALAWILAKELLTTIKVPQATKDDFDKWYIVVRDVVADLVQGAVVSSP